MTQVKLIYTIMTREYEKVELCRWLTLPIEPAVGMQIDLFGDKFRITEIAVRLEVGKGQTVECLLGAPEITSPLELWPRVAKYQERGWEQTS